MKFPEPCVIQHLHTICMLNVVFGVCKEAMILQATWMVALCCTNACNLGDKLTCLAAVGRQSEIWGVFASLSSSVWQEAESALEQVWARCRRSPGWSGVAVTESNVLRRELSFKSSKKMLDVHECLVIRFLTRGGKNLWLQFMVYTSVPIVLWDKISDEAVQYPCCTSI